VASSVSTKRRQNGVGNEEGLGRSSTSKPQLLSQLPRSIFTSPGFIMGLVAMELLYGLFLFAVMTTRKRNRIEAEANAALYAQAAPAESSIPHVEPAPAAHSPTEPTHRTDSAAPNPPEPATTPAPAPKIAAQTAATTPPKTEPVDEPKPKPKPKKGGKSKRGEPAAKTELAAATPLPTPESLEEAQKPKSTATFPQLGALIDPLQDTTVSSEDGMVIIKVASGAHVFDPSHGIADAPRALTEVEGDFTAEVKFLGDLKPGTEPLKGLPFTFQGAGLLVWHDKENYIRFERAAAYAGDRLQMIHLESCKDGKAVPKKPINVRDGAVTLRLERRGKLVTYTYSVDGKTWLKVDQSTTTLPRKVGIGIAANNVSPRPFSARFADFVLKPSS